MYPLSALPLPDSHVLWQMTWLDFKMLTPLPFRTTFRITQSFSDCVSWLSLHYFLCVSVSVISIKVYLLSWKKNLYYIFAAYNFHNSLFDGYLSFSNKIKEKCVCGWVGVCLGMLIQPYFTWWCILYNTAITLAQHQQRNSCHHVW